MFTSDEIIGQDALLFSIAPFTIDTLPHSIILSGDKGSGKHLISKYIADKFNLYYIELDKMTEEEIEDIVLNPLPTLYVINLDNAIPKSQNNLLKIIEDPSANIFFMGLSSDTNTILPTLSNRCKMWKMSCYSENELKKFISEEHKDIEKELLEIFNTPGQILNAQQHPIKEIQAFTNDIIERISESSVPNVFTIADKLAFKNEKEKYDLDIFVKSLNHSILKKVKENKDEKWVRMFNVIAQLESRLNICISKQRTVEETLMELRLAA